MYDVIKKALDEALTEKYYSELMECEDIKHAFSAGFVSEMKALIRKTDNKLIYYSRYIGVAACAVLAIGCAVLVPTLLERDIDVAQPDTTTSVTETVTAVTTEPPADSDAGDADAAATTPEATTAPADSTTVSETTADTTVTTTVTTTSTTTPPETTTKDDVTSVVTDDDDVNPGHGGGDDEPADTAEDEDDDDDATVNGDTVIEEDDADDDTDSDDDVVVEDDDAEDDADSDDDVVIDDSGDDDAVIEDDVEEDADDDEAVDEDADDDENPAGGPTGESRPVPGDKLSEIFGYYYWDDVTRDALDNLFVTRLTKGDYFADPEFIDTGFVMDYLKANRNAERVYDYENYEMDTFNDITVYLSAAPLPASRTFADYSDRNNYQGIFYGEDETDEVDEDVCEDDGVEIHVNIYSCGLISVQGEEIWNETAYFKADLTLTEWLFDQFNDEDITGEFDNLGSLMGAFGLTAEGITHGYAECKSIYDVQFKNAHIDTDNEKQELVKLLNKYKDKVPTWTDHAGPHWSDVIVCIDVGLSEAKTVLSIRLTEDKLWFEGYIGECWYINADENDLKKFISYAASTEDIPEVDFFTDAYGYVTERADFSKLKTAIYTTTDNGKAVEYVLNEETACEELRVILAEELKNSEYMPMNNSRFANARNLLTFDMGEWNIYISESGVIGAGYCNFQGSDGVHDRLAEFIAKKAPAADVEEETDVDECDCEDEAEWEYDE